MLVEGEGAPHNDHVSCGGTLASWAPDYDLDSRRGIWLIGLKFFNLVKLLT